MKHTGIWLVFALLALVCFTAVSGAVTSTAPLLGQIPKVIYACEGSSFSYNINAADLNPDSLQISVSPANPFFVYPSDFTGQTSLQSHLFSGILSKSDVGSYALTLSVSDGYYSDSENTAVTVIETNHPPVINPIGVQTVSTNSSNSNFHKQLDVHDAESGGADSGNLSFRITSLNGNKFIDVSKDGMIRIVGNAIPAGVYNISVCATDQALSIAPVNIGLCGQDGSSMTSCTEFSITATNNNKKPAITSFYPNITTDANLSGKLYFNISTYDSDGTIPDIYWYVDNVQKRYASGASSDSFNYSSPCGVSGQHVVKAEITDGILNDSVSWNISSSNLPCFSQEQTTENCSVVWACGSWQTCQSVNISFGLALISDNQYKQIKSQCDSLGLSDADCGMQIRSCSDVNSCNVTDKMLPLLQACRYSENPSCYDHLKNCHDGGCELLTDCGGPCAPCSSCSDGKQNQGEEGIDCGGPCPFLCPTEKSYSIFDNIYFVAMLWLLLLILLITLTWLVYRTIREGLEFERQKKLSRVFRQ